MFLNIYYIHIEHIYMCHRITTHLQLSRLTLRDMRANNQNMLTFQRFLYVWFCSLQAVAVKRFYNSAHEPNNVAKGVYSGLCCCLCSEYLYYLLAPLPNPGGLNVYHTTTIPTPYRNQSSIIPQPYQQHTTNKDNIDKHINTTNKNPKHKTVGL